MMSPILPMALAFAALALVHVLLPWRTIATGIAVAAGLAGIIAAVGTPMLAADTAFALCWAAVAASAITVIVRPGPPRRLALLLGVFTGVAVGLLAAATAGVGALIASTPALLVLLLAALPRWSWVPLFARIVSGWILAVSLLAAAIPLVATPGYRSDHRE